MKTTINLIEEFKSKACCYYTQKEAMSIWIKLEPLLNEEERFNIHLGWAHYQIGEGTAELFDECNKTIQRRNSGE